MKEDYENLKSKVLNEGFKQEEKKEKVNEQDYHVVYHTLQDFLGDEYDGDHNAQQEIVVQNQNQNLLQNLADANNRVRGAMLPGVQRNDPVLDKKKKRGT